MISVFVERVADAANTNAQSVSSKEIVARLDPQRFHVTMLAQSRTIDPRIAARPNTTIITLEGKGKAVRLLRHLFLHPPDVYFFPGSGLPFSVFGRLRHLLARRTKVVVYVVGSLRALKRAPTLLDEPAQWLRAYDNAVELIRRSDMVVGNSRVVSEEVSEDFGIPTETIHSGINRDVFYPTPSREMAGGSITALYAGSFQNRKRPKFIVSMAAQWPNVQFRMAGAGPELAACQQLAREQGCTNVQFIGHLSQVALAAEMRGADLFLFPSLIEGHPQVLGQAAACGLPSVAMNIYRPDYVAHGESGYLAGSDAEFLDAAAQLFTDSDCRRRMSKAAVDHSQQFDWQGSTDRWATVFERAAASRKG